MSRNERGGFETQQPVSDVVRKPVVGVVRAIAAIRLEHASFGARDDLAGLPGALVADVMKLAEDVGCSASLVSDVPEESFKAGLHWMSVIERKVSALGRILDAARPLARVTAAELAHARAAQWGSRQLTGLSVALAALTADAFARTPKLAGVKLDLPVIAGLPRPTFELEANDPALDTGEFWRLIGSAHTSA